jgi:hypothetical protein
MTDTISTGALSDLLLDQTDKGLARQIYSKREFKDLDDTPSGELRPHQENIMKLMGPQVSLPDMALFWSTGLGKGYTIAQIIRMISAFPARYGRHKTLVISKASVMPQWHAELSRFPEFTTAKIRDAKSEYKPKGREKATSTSIKKKVLLMPLDTFSAKLLKLSPDKIRELYSCECCVIDEAHFLRIKDDPQDLSIEALSSADEFHDTKLAYLMMHKLFQAAIIGTKIIATATPMYDSPKELVSICSFILPEELQLNVQDFESALAKGKGALKAYLEPRLRGRVSYVNYKGGLAPVTEEGDYFTYEENGVRRTSTFKIVEIPMLEEQEELYVKLLEDAEERTELAHRGIKRVQGERSEAFYGDQRMVLNFVYIDPYDPDNNSYKGFEYFFDPDDVGSKSKNKDGFVIMKPSLQPTREEKAEYKRLGLKKRPDLKPTRFSFRYRDELFEGCPPRNPDLKRFGPGSELDPKRLAVIRRMSAKYAFIIETVHNDLRYPGEGEFAFVYNSLLRNGGGILLGMCFYEMGYDVLLGVEEDSIEFLDEKPRFAFMTGEPASTPARNRNIRAIVNDKRNAFGQLVAVVIASQTAGVGLSYVNARKMFHIGGDFSITTQPEGRVNRTDSHRFFTEPRQKFVRKYFLACTTADGSPTTDHKLWAIIQKKEDQIRLPGDVLSEISVDCGLKPGPCREKFRGTPTDFDTYHLHWAQAEFDRIEVIIRRAFQIKNVWTFGELEALMGREHRVDTLIWTLRGMLDRKTIIQDRFGFPLALRECSGVYFLDSLGGGSLPLLTPLASFTSSSSPLSTSLSPQTHARLNHSLLTSHYTSQISLRNNTDFRTISTATVLGNLKSDTDALLVDMANWEKHDVDAGLMRMMRLEQALLGRIEDTKIRDFILKDLEVAWFRLGSVTFHYLDEVRPKGNSGAYVANRRKIEPKKESIGIRVLAKGAKEFVQAPASKVAAYVDLINKRWDERDAAIMKKSPVDFAVIKNVSADMHIRIRPPSNIRYKANGEIDGRSVKKGLDATSYDVKVLVGFLYELEASQNQEVELDVDEGTLNTSLKKSIGDIKGWTREKKAFYYSWLEEGSAYSLKERLISAIEASASRLGVLFKK